MKTLLCCLILCLPVLSRAETLHLLVAVGNNHGLSGEEPLKHAAGDARQLAKLLQTLGDVRKEHALVLADASPQELERALQKAKALAKGRRADEVTFVFYYSGHGDKDALHLGPQKLADSRLKALIGQIPAGMKVLIIDACRSEGAARPKGWGLKPAVAISLKPPPGPQGVIELRSSSEGEASQESDELGGGVFTHYLLTGLRGAADADGNGQVTLDEVYPYAYNRTIMRTGTSKVQVQRPYAAFDFRGTGPLVLTRTSQARSQLVFPQGSNIHYLVYRIPQATVMAEVWGEPKRPVKLALSQGRYLVQRRAPGKYGATEIALTFGGARQLSAWQFQPFPLKLLAQKGGNLIIHRHELAAQYGFIAGHHGDLGHRATVGYGYRLGPSTLCARAHLGMTWNQEDSYDQATRWLGGDLFGKWNHPFGPLTTSLGLGVSLQYRDQTLEHIDPASGLGLKTDASTSYLAAGPMIEGSIDIYLGSDLSLNLGLSLASLFYQDSERVSFSLDGSAWAGVTWGL